MRFDVNVFVRVNGWVAEQTVDRFSRRRVRLAALALDKNHKFVAFIDD